MKNIFYLGLLLCVISAPSNARKLVLTGQIGSSEKQIVSAPQGSRWQIQIQWMEEEGKIVQAGNPVVVFDGEAEQGQLTQQQETLDRLLLELEELKLEQAQKVIEAKGNLKVATMRVEQAKIEASVPDGEVSAFDKGQFELALQNAILEKIKAQEAFAMAEQEQRSELTKKQVDILTSKEEIAYLKNILGKLNVVAQVTGPVSYAIHPWYGTKLSAGMNVRASWKVLDIQSTNSFQIDTWIHEIDAVNLKEDVPLQVSLDAYPGKTYAARISSLSRQSERKAQWSKSAYFPAVVSFIDKPQINLSPGMSVRLLVQKEDIKND